MSTPNLPGPVRELLDAILETITLPEPITAAGIKVRDQILSHRVSLAKGALRLLLEDGLGPDVSTQYLRERIADHPAVGYATAAQAGTALAQGKTIVEALTPAQSDGKGLSKAASHSMPGGQTERLVATMLGEIASQLTIHRPDEDLTTTARLAVIQATTFDPVLSRELDARMPEITDRITRRAYASLIRKSLPDADDGGSGQAR